MTIKYKFKKSSEVRDCVVESVEVIVIKENKTIVGLETIYEILNKYEQDPPTDVIDIYDILCYFNDGRFENVENEVLYEESYGNQHSVEGEYKFDDKVLFVKLEYLHQSGHGDFNCELIQSYVIDTKTETKQFSSQQELKEYINTIQEPIEFIAESDIDQVLMKEWIGEWELSYNCDECNNRNLGYYDDCDYNLCGKKEVKTGSPKLNSNWKFKIN